ncbi:MAG: hypothetical protein Q9186_004893 [Xanthomendoza sp. 1 TL-2023]
MGLVEYSDSEGSGAEEKPVVNKAPKPPTNASKPAFQKVVDRSNPHKIRVNLPEPAKESTGDRIDEEEPPAKKARVGGGAFGGFNSFLPAPKRTTATVGGSKRNGLGSGVNLKTGAAPGFSREPMPEPNQNQEEVAEDLNQESALPGRTALIENNHETIGTSKPPSPELVGKPKEAPRKQGNAMMFKPLSVARKPQKKKAMGPKADATTTSPKEALTPPQPRVTPTISLFATNTDLNDSINGNIPSGTYQPMIYGASEPEDSSARPPPTENYYMEDSTVAEEPDDGSNVAPGPQSLDTIASDLNLSASAKRQLLGRQNRKSSAINVVHFNTDQEYAANELLRQAGETVQHNPVRAIAPGKHSLKQLVNAASNQKDALEEQFASGRRNKKEAGSKYGW